MIEIECKMSFEGDTKRKVGEKEQGKQGEKKMKKREKKLIGMKKEGRINLKEESSRIAERANRGEGRNAQKDEEAKD